MRKKAVFLEEKNNRLVERSFDDGVLDWMSETNEAVPEYVSLGNAEPSKPELPDADTDFATMPETLA